MSATARNSGENLDGRDVKRNMGWNIEFLHGRKIKKP
jgi:hypothetical protein